MTVKDAYHGEYPLEGGRLEHPLEYLRGRHAMLFNSVPNVQDIQVV
jgi:hypothetical protein